MAVIKLEGYAFFPGAAHTVFTFVDNELTAKENEENVTDSALAQLYAHIQGLPDSSRKRKLVKQFNKQNGHVKCDCISKSLYWELTGFFRALHCKLSEVRYQRIKVLAIPSRSTCFIGRF